MALAIKDLGLRHLEIGLVEDVENFGSKLQVQPFPPKPKGPVLENRKVKVLQAGTAQRVASQIPELAECRVREALQLDIVVRVAGIHRIGSAAWNVIEIRSLSPGTAFRSAISSARLVVRKGHGEGRACLGGKDPAEHPSP